MSLAVLYVDDDPVRCEAVRAMLCPIADLKLHTAACGEEAIAFLAAPRVDLVLTDAILSDADGFAGFGRLRENPLIDHIPVIVLADNPSSAEIERLMQLGASGVIGKPIDPLSVRNKLMNLWLGHNANRAPLGAGAVDSQIPTPADALAAQFLRRTQRDLNRLNELINRAASGDWTVLEESACICHAICGAAAMFGYPQLSRAAATMQDSVQYALRNPNAPPSTNGLAALSLLDSADAFARALRESDRSAPDAGSMFQPRGRDH